MQKVSRFRSAISNETILVTSLCKRCSLIKHNWHCIIEFWLILLSWMFISSYTTFCFFVKKFIFWNVYNSVNIIFECLYMFFVWEMAHQLSTCASDGGMRSSSKMPTIVYKGTWCHTSFICKHLLYILSCFWRNFCLIVSCFICRNLTLPLFKKDALYKICENMGFHWPVFSRIRTKSTIRVSENLYSCIFYAVMCSSETSFFLQRDQFLLSWNKLFFT